MEFKNFTFKDIKYRNGPETDPQLTMKYSAESMDDGTIKEARDKWEELPQPAFREIWRELVQFWKINLEELISKEDGIIWDYENIRISRVKIEWKNGKPIMVQYFAEVSAEFGETAKVPTPSMQPAVVEGEVEAINNLADEAKAFLHGARSQRSLDFDNEGAPEDESKGTPKGEPKDKPTSDSYESASESQDEDNHVELNFTPPNTS